MARTIRYHFLQISLLDGLPRRKVLMEVIVRDVQVIEIDILIHIFRQCLLISIGTWSQIIKMFFDMFGLFAAGAIALIIFDVVLKIYNTDTVRLMIYSLIKCLSIQREPRFPVIEKVVDDSGMMKVFGIQDCRRVISIARIAMGQL